LKPGTRPLPRLDLAPRDFNVNRPTGPADDFVLRFEKPR
jgi:hypothetical protein